MTSFGPEIRLSVQRIEERLILCAKKIDLDNLQIQANNIVTELKIIRQNLPPTEKELDYTENVRHPNRLVSAIAGKLVPALRGANDSTPKTPNPLSKLLGSLKQDNNQSV